MVYKKAWRVLRAGRDCILPEVGAGQTAEMAVGIERKGVDLWETGEAKSTWQLQLWPIRTDMKASEGVPSQIKRQSLTKRSH